VTEKTGWEAIRSYPGIAVGDPNTLDRLTVWRALRRMDVDRSWIDVSGEADVCAMLVVRRIKGPMDNLIFDVGKFVMN